MVLLNLAKLKTEKKEKQISSWSCYHSAVAVVFEPEWAVQAVVMEVVVLALVAEVVGVWPGSESL